MRTRRDAPRRNEAVDALRSSIAARREIASPFQNAEHLYRKAGSSQQTVSPQKGRRLCRWCIDTREPLRAIIQV